MFRKRNLGVLMALAIIIAFGFTACEELSNFFDPDDPDKPYKLGDTGPGGGIIFYYDEEGFKLVGEDGLYHYLEAALEDFISLQWGVDDGGMVFKDNTELGLGFGKQNTLIIASPPRYFPASSECLAFETTVKGEVFNDWFLPSLDELELLINNRSLLGDHIGNMNTGIYWSSSENYYSPSESDDMSPVTHAWALDSSGFILVGAEYLKNKPYNVRPIRAF